jgi:hypothetical protein
MRAKKALVTAPRPGVALGIYSQQSDVDAVIEALRVWGYRSDTISVLLPGPAAAKVIPMEGALRWLGLKRVLVLPGIGPVRAAGPMRLAFDDMGSDSAVGLDGVLTGLNIPLPDAKEYESRVRNGGLLVCIQVEESYWTLTAQDILAVTGAECAAAFVPAEES